MPARQLRSHAAILRGLGLALVLCELASNASITPSLTRDGLGPLLALPFFAPSLAGSFAAQALLRPNRLELAVTAVFAALVFVPLFAVTGGPYALVSAALAALGTGSLVSLAVVALRHRGDDRERVLEVLLPALILPAFVILAHPMIYLTAALWPATFDHRMYLADAAFGAPLSFVIGQWTASVPGLSDICLAVYVCLPLALMLVHAMRTRAGVRSSDTLVTFVAVTVVGYFGYHLVPVAGPVYVFAGAFPHSPPDPASLDGARSLALVMPRNCMPSLHSAWALLVWWNSRPLVRWQRVLAGVFLAITLLATVGLGFHYVVDLVAAFPLTVAVAAWTTRVADETLRVRTMAVGFVLTLAWMVFVTWGGALFALPAAALWILAASVVGVSWYLERRISDSAVEEAPPPLVAMRSGRPLTAAVFAVLFAGFASALHAEMLSNALVLVAGSSAAMRAWLVLLPVAGIALGLAASRFVRPSLAAAASAALAATGWSWLAMAMLPWIAEVTAAGASVVHGAAAALVIGPGGFAAGVFVANLARGVPDPFPRGTTAFLAGTAMIGAGIAALSAAYLLRPTVAFHSVPLFGFVVATVLAAGLAYRVSPAAVEETSQTGGARLRAAATALAAGVLLATIAHLFTAVAGDTVYSRHQLVAVALVGLGTGALVARSLRMTGRDGRMHYAWSMLGLAGAVVLTLPLWTTMPAYFASFEGYGEEIQMMTVFRQREFVRLAACMLFVLPAAVGAGAAMFFATAESKSESSRASTDVVPIAVLVLVVAAIATRFMLVPAIGSRMTIACTAGAILLALVALLRDGAGSRRMFGGLVALTAAVLPLAAARLELAPLVSTSGLTFRHQTSAGIVETAETADGIVAVHRSPDGGVGTLTINGLVAARDASDAEPESVGPGAAPGGKRVLVIGATNPQSIAALRSAGFEEIVVAESRSSVIRYAQAISPSTFPAGAVRQVDGRTALHAGGEYDLVRIDELEMSIPETAALSTKDFYTAVARRLSPGGVLEQRLALDRLSAIALAALLASARHAFPELGVSFAGDRALLVACAGCAPGVRALPATDSSRDAASMAGRLEPADVDGLLAAIAAKFEITPDKLATTDRDMFLAYQVPYSFVAPPGAPESARMLFSVARPAAGAPAF